jgi:hypothetical protein
VVKGGAGRHDRGIDLKLNCSAEHLHSGGAFGLGEPCFGKLASNRTDQRALINLFANKFLQNETSGVYCVAG